MNLPEADTAAAKKRLQEHLRDGLVLIVGSGLSCAEGMPGMTELAGHLLKTVGSNLTGDDAAGWDATTPLIATSGLEAALLKKPPSPTLELAIAASVASMIYAREREVVAEVFSGQRKLRLTRFMHHIVMSSAGLPIVTTNYDRLIEVAVEEAEVGADTMFSGRFAGVLNDRESRLGFCRDVKPKRRGSFVLCYKPRALICKPHGSLGWYLRGEKPVSYAGDLPGVPPLIITPGNNKFRNGYESPFDHHLNKANEAIDRASRFLVIGYGFNDGHLETHLLPAIRGGKPTLMVTQALSPKAEALAQDNMNVITLDEFSQDGVHGTRLIIDRTETFIPHHKLWDVDSFITEVLEP
jgi:hypothetical protein